MISTLPSPKALLRSFLTSFVSKKFKVLVIKPTTDVIKILVDLVSHSKLKVIIDKEFNMSDLPQAHLYSETGRAKGKILIKVS